MSGSVDNTIYHVGAPNIGNQQDLFERIKDILDRKWLTNVGYYVCELEKRLQDYLGVKHCIALCNGTIALEIAIRAMGLKGEVIVPAFTFVATAHALQWQEITPVFVDVDAETYNINPDKVSEAVTAKTTGIIGVHLWGRPCDVQALCEIGKTHDLKVLFDAAHAFGCSLGGTAIGNFGDCEVFSFHATKFFNTFEGGAVVTNDDKLAAKIRLMQNFGFSGMDNVIYIGTNGKMNEVCAAMGLTNLDSLDGFIQANYMNYKAYRKELADIEGIELLEYNENENNNFQYIVMDVDESDYGKKRDDLMLYLHKQGVRARRYFYPGCHRMEPYCTLYPDQVGLFPVTDMLCGRILCLPTGTSVGQKDIINICNLIRLFQKL